MKTRKAAKGHQLFNDNPRGRSVVTGIGYGTADKARRSLKKIAKRPAAYQRQAATTMYYRAKYHKYQTAGMKAAMKVYGAFLKGLTRRK